jgi:hypothetical protein
MEDIPVKIRDSYILVDFMVLKIDVYHQIPLILGRPFFNTVGATIDVVAGMIRLNINGKETFAFKPKGIEQCNHVRVSAGRKRNNAKTPRKKPEESKYSKTKFMWHVKNATPTMPPSLVSLAN